MAVAFGDLALVAGDKLLPYGGASAAPKSAEGGPGWRHSA